MAHSTRAAANIISFAQAIRSHGLQEAAREFGIADLTGKPLDEVLPLLTEAFCDPGGEVDDGITNRAWSDTVLAVLDQEISDINAITNPDQWRAITEIFITETICQRIYNDIGNKTLAVTQNTAAMNQLNTELRTLVQCAVAGRVAPILATEDRHTHGEFQIQVDQIYHAAFAYLEAANEEE